MHTILRPILPLHDLADFPDAFARVVADSTDRVCRVCGLERMGHAPESGWLGHDPHPWTGVPATPEQVARARELTREAYAARH